MANTTDWLSISSSSGSSGQTILTVNARKNLTTDFKTAEIRAYNPVYNISATTYVTMEQYSPYIYVQDSIIGIPESGGTYQLVIDANCSYVISFPDMVTSYSASAGTGNTTITFTVPSTYDSGTVVQNIVITDENGQYSTTVRLEQYGGGAYIIPSTNELFFDSTGGSLTFSVSANCPYNINDAAISGWSSTSPRSGYTGSTTFTVTMSGANTGESAYTGMLIINGPGSTTVLINITQRAPERRLVAKYSVTSTTEPTAILNSQGLRYISKAEYQDGTIPTATAYTFPSTGVQTVYYTLNRTGLFPDYLFNNVDTLRSVFVPEGYFLIGTGCFSSCDSLSSVTLPDSLTSINSNAFRDCTSLSSITIPSGVTFIGGQCFSGSSVSSITFTSLTPPTLSDTSALTSDALSEIIVPCPAVNDYITAWPQYAQYISCSETGTTIYFITDTSNVAGTGETRTITILNTDINPNDIGLNLPSDFPSPGSYVVSGNVIYLTYPANPSSSATRTWTIGVVGMTTGGTSLSGSYQITQNPYVLVDIPYTADTSAVAATGETRTITIDTSGLVASSITIGVEGATGVTTTYQNGVITVVFPPYSGTSRPIAIVVSGQTENGDAAKATISYLQGSGSGLNDYLTIRVRNEGDATVGTIKWQPHMTNYDGNAFNRTIQYSKNGSNWTDIRAGWSSNGNIISATIEVSKGDIIQFRGNYDYYSIEQEDPLFPGVGFSIRGLNVDISGNLMSLVSSNNFPSVTGFTGTANFYRMFALNNTIINASGLTLGATKVTKYSFYFLFQGCRNLITAPELPATTLAEECYNGMFIDCSGLTQAPALPATTMAMLCYFDMFANCTSLTTAPALPATTLAIQCYNAMFRNCTSLTQTPELPATSLTDSCYVWMFQGCTSLTTVPELPATTLAYDCYMQMFSGCTNLNYIKCLATNIVYNNSTADWVNGVAATGTFVKNPSMSSWTTGNSGIPSGWTVQDAT